ncbi:ankyrin repeat domain-containing protein [Brachyspira hampsonii]|uniref:Ankyrin repeat-containing protein n=2 Tax=Brachyspira hampsonii TaxID=1287055 RepID=A0A2U4EVB1_9SPIR|nr:ankyrin repeat domain-containing protein [Brachyspira hampsonii]EKV56756.1 ankyrin repeat-containing protein [Brachyspira hampsonii 30446]MBW5389838.1 ankyrin repeat domain-containing protein [Brachyspira hampsonii]MBW5393938.1 ankyrin repeat domain-containing protein [Brachyspira hampsonii]
MKLSFVFAFTLYIGSILLADTRIDFFSAVNRGDIKSVKEYIEMGININLQDERKRTPLMIAAYKNDVKMVKLLVDNDANVNIQDEKLNSPFLYASSRGMLNIIKLIYKKADTRNVLNIFGSNALILACEKEHLGTVKFLLENTDIDVNHINHLSYTALLEVAIVGNDSLNYAEIVKILLEHGADKTIKDKNGHDALYYAKARNLKNIEKLLAE